MNTTTIGKMIFHLQDLRLQDQKQIQLGFYRVKFGSTVTLIISSSKDFQRQGHSERALAMLHQMIEDAQMGKGIFLALHNLAIAIADEENKREYMKSESLYPDKDGLNHDKDVVLGLGLRPTKQPLFGGEKSIASTSYGVKDTDKRIYGPFTSKAITYLTQFILHIASIGDIVDGTDTTYDFNYFSLIYEWPKDVHPLHS